MSIGLLALTLLPIVLILCLLLVFRRAADVCGIIGWVGLVVPHMARMVTGPGFARLLPVAALFGRAAGRVALDQVELAERGIGEGAVGEFPGEQAALEPPRAVAGGRG